MTREKPQIDYNFIPVDKKKVLSEIGKDKALASLKKMLGIRNFELRAESAYQQGKIGGFFHSYAGQEAIQTSCIDILGKNDPWYITTYRCHALALLLGVTPKEIMAELYGRSTGNAFGRGGSMHLYSDRMLGGFGIVGGHLPVAMGAAFSLKYLKKDSLALCFLGDGAVAQGAFHESLNIASLWSLPVVVVIENNLWGMGTAVERAICVKPMAERLAPGYGLSGYSIDGRDYILCYGGFLKVFEEAKRTKRPILVEVVTERFKGHSVSDPAHYRSKESLQEILKFADPILRLKDELKEARYITEEDFEKYDDEQRNIVMEAMKFADESPWPDVTTLEDGVYASQEGRDLNERS